VIKCYPNLYYPTLLYPIVRIKKRKRKTYIQGLSQPKQQIIINAQRYLNCGIALTTSCQRLTPMLVMRVHVRLHWS